MVEVFSRPVWRDAAGASAAALLAACLLWVSWVSHAPRPARPDAPARLGSAAHPAPPPAALNRAATPLLFEPNLGQAPNAVRYLGRGAARGLAIFDDGVAIAPRGDAAGAQLRFVGSRGATGFAEREAASGRIHHLRGADPLAWQTQVPRFAQLVQRGLYPGIDLVYYSRGGDFEFDLVVQPGADPGAVRMQAHGPKPAHIDEAGDLWLDGQGGQLRVKRPIGLQHIDGRRVELPGRWVLGADGLLRLAMPRHDRSRTLVIDPVFKLLHGTYLGGVHDDQVGAITLDAAGNAYVVGNSGSEDWPVSGNAVQTVRKALGTYVRNIVVTKFDATGTLVWSTFLGGSVNDYGRGIAVDARGQVVVAGYSLSPDFPTTAQAHQRTLNGSQNAVLAVLSPDGSSLVYGSYYGGAGASEANALALDRDGTLVMAGSADPGLPTTAGVYKPTLATGRGAFVARFSASATGAPQLLAASYLGVDNPAANGTSQGVQALGMALDAAGAPWLAAIAYTPNLPVTAGAVQAAPPAMSTGCAPGPGPLNSFAYVGKLSRDFRTLDYASYLSGRTQAAGGTSCSEFARNVTLDADGNVYLTGGTGSATFPTTAGALQPTSPIGGAFGAYASFVSKLRPDGAAILWSTYLGGNQGSTFTQAIVHDAANSALWTLSFTGGGSNHPLTADALQAVHGGGSSDAGLVQLDAATGALRYATYMGGAGTDVGLALAVDGSGTVFAAGSTDSRNLTVTSTAYQASYTANAFDGSDWFFRVLGSGAITAVRPAAGGSGGDVTLSIHGVGMLPGAVAELVSAGRTVTATATSGDPRDGDLRATFRLDGVAEGAYDVVVRQPDGTVLRRPAAFTVQAGGRPQVWASIIGRPKIRTGRAAEFQLTYGNSGSVDAYFTAVWVRVPAGFDTPEVVPAIVDPYNPAHTFGHETVWDTGADGSRSMAILLPLLRAGSTGSIAFRLTDPRPSSEWVLSTTVEAPWFDSFDEARAALSAVAAGAVPAAACVPHATKPYLSNCLGVWSDRHVKQANPAIQQFARQERLTIDPAAMTAGLHRGHASTLERALLEAGASPAQPTATTRAQAVRTSLKRPQDGGTAGGMVGPSGQPMNPTPTPPVPVQGPSGTPMNAPPPTSSPKPGIGSNAIFKGITDGIGAAANFVQVVGQLAQLGNFIRYQDLCYLWGLGGSVPPGVKADKGECRGGVQTIFVTFHCTHGKYTYSEDAQCEPPDPCKGGGPPPPNGSCSGGGSGGSADPNDKFGLPGDRSASRYLSALVRALPYRIGFENLASATLPAAEVVVTDQLDPAKVDLSTLSLGDISWGPHTVAVPPGLSSYATTFQIDATLAVRVAASLNPTTGLLKWTFTTLDPATHLPPSDPTLGFLPPNRNGSEGQGYVNFTVSPRAGQADGTRWENFATIVFDANAPILTPVWVNTLDTTPPVGRVTTATQQAGSTDVDVAWTATDTGSGAARYTVMVSDNGGPFATWQSAVSTTAAVFSATAGHRYGFHVIASDAAGNTEAAKSGAEASVAVTEPGSTTAGGGAAAGGGGGCTVAPPGREDHALLVLLAVLVSWRAAALARRRHGALRGRPLRPRRGRRPWRSSGTGSR